MLLENLEISAVFSVSESVRDQVGPSTLLIPQQRSSIRRWVGRDLFFPALGELDRNSIAVFAGSCLKQPAACMPHWMLLIVGLSL